MQAPAAPPNSRLKVAVIGAGASGLVAARELQRESHRVVVFELNNRIGGTWVYTPTAESDPLSLDPSRTIVHTSLYNSLRTNLPREAMGFGDYPFLGKEDGDPRRFPSHREVLRYLDDFTIEFGLKELIRFETRVEYVGLNQDRKWEVRSRNGYGEVDIEAYDAVVVCNGHYTTPHLAEIPGIDVWPGKQIHSHNYRVPDPFSEKVVVLVGNSHSGFDISRDIARVAKEVHVASKSIVNAAPMEQHASDNLWFHSMIEMAREDGTVVFQDGSSVFADVILHCTGYKFDFPFLKTDGIVTVDDNRVGPLYQHIFPPQLAPWLSFIGLPWQVCPFPLYELQSKWVAGILAGKISLPSQENMISDVKALYSKLDAAEVPKRYTHSIMGCQFEYSDWLADQCGLTPDKWRNEMWKATALNRSVRPETYRDEWEDEDLILQAHEEFIQYTR